MANVKKHNNSAGKTAGIVIAFVLVFAILAGLLTYLLGGFNNLLNDTYFFRAGEVAVSGAEVKDGDDGKYIENLTEDGTITFAFTATAEAEGNLSVSVQAKAADARLDDLLVVSVNGLPFSAGNTVIKGDAGGSWREAEIGAVTLNKGKNTVTVKGTSAGVNVGYVAFEVPHSVKLTVLAAEAAQTEQTGGLEASVDEAEDGSVSLVTRRIAREQFNDYGISPIAESAFTATATVKIKGTDDTPDYIKGVTWKMEWATSNSAAVTDYVTMTENEGAMSATFSCKKAFPTKITVTCTSKFDGAASATLTLDYRKRVTAIKYKFGDITGQIPVSGSSQVVTATFPTEYGFTSHTSGGTDWDKSDWLKFYTESVFTDGTLNPNTTASPGGGYIVTVTPSSALQTKYNSIKDSRNKDMLATAQTGNSNASSSLGWANSVLDFYCSLTQFAHTNLSDMQSFFGMGGCSSLCTALALTSNQFTVQIKTWDVTVNYTLNVKMKTQPNVSLTVDNSNFIF